MKFLSCDAIIKHFLFLEQVIKTLDQDNFEFLTEQEIIQEKSVIIEELELDTVFKLLTKLEAEIKQDYNYAIRSKRKDDLSKNYLSLCKRFRKRIKKYDKPLKKVCRKVSLDDILDEVKSFFKDSNPTFAQNVSILKGYFKFRHGYADGRYFHKTPPIPAIQHLQILCQEFKTHVFLRKK
ncbi:MAG: hypothetical protein VSS75_022100 [Candidatus Parabeggiatoa sp.]|nr:hypothetical protein [Candidatus Parabeggiatoa sp.]